MLSGLTAADLPDGLDTEALKRCLEVTRAIVPDVDRLEVTITSDFERAVRRAYNHDDYAMHYVQDRGAFGSAMAKTVPKDDGTIEMIVDAHVLAQGQDIGIPERTFAHEGYHVAIHQREECLFDLGLRGSDAGFNAESRYLAMAGIACEEFRVERTLCAASPNGHYESFPDLLSSFDTTLEQLSHEYERTHDVESISHGVMEHFHSIVTATGYVAAAMEARDAALPTIDRRTDDRVFGSPGVSVIECIRQLPPADQPASASDLEERAAQVAEELRTWIDAIGFRWDDTADGGLYFHVLKPHRWLLGVA
jgi:hypothetical protein